MNLTPFLVRKVTVALCHLIPSNDEATIHINSLWTLRLHRDANALANPLLCQIKCCTSLLNGPDLTNTFFHGRQKGELLRCGRSREKRTDCPLVTLALTLNASGFPRSAQILRGNASEPATLQQAIENLNGATPTVIMDAGIATKANLAYLKENNLDWICVERIKAPPVPTEPPDQRFETANEVQVQAWKLSKEEGALRVYVHSEAQQATQEQILQTKCKRFEAALEYLNEGLPLPRRVKNISKVARKVGRLQEKYRAVAHLYEVEVKQKKGTHLAESVTFSARASHQTRTQATGG